MASEHDYNGHFSSNYRTYKIFIQTDGDTAGNAWYIRFASTGSYTYDTGSSYKYTYLYNNTSGSGQGRDFGSGQIRHGWNGGGTAATHVTTELSLYNPSCTTFPKHVNLQSAFWDGTGVWGNAVGSGHWTNTAAITGIRFYGGGNTRVQNIQIYGLKA